MTRKEHLLAIVAEEAAEVVQRATKALRFSLREVQPGQDKTNLERLGSEMCDLHAAWQMLLGVEYIFFDDELIARKKAKVEEFLKLSQRLGTLDE